MSRRSSSGAIETELLQATHWIVESLRIPDGQIILPSRIDQEPYTFHGIRIVRDDELVMFPWDAEGRG